MAAAPAAGRRASAGAADVHVGNDRHAQGRAAAACEPLAAGRAVSAWHGLDASDRCLSSLPLYHINGQCIATITPFVSGGSLVAPHRFSASAWWPLVDAHRPTWLNMVPTIIAYLINAAGADTGKRFESVRFGRSASAPLPPEQHRAFEARFGIGVVEAMGMTESSSVMLCNPQDPARRKIGSPGLPCGVEVKVVAPADPHSAALPDGERGELLLRGPNVMSGYYKAPALTAAALTPDGWLRTGDLGWRDADGMYFISGRLKELIIKGGENIAPREIDEALLSHDAILEAAAVGHPRRALRPGHPRLRRAEKRPPVHRGRAPRPLPARARTLQDAADHPHRRRAAEGPIRQDPAVEAARSRVGRVPD